MQITITAHEVDSWGRLGQALTMWAGSDARRQAAAWLRSHPGLRLVVVAL